MHVMGIVQRHTTGNQEFAVRLDLHRVQIHGHMAKHGFAVRHKKTHGELPAHDEIRLCRVPNLSHTTNTQLCCVPKAGTRQNSYHVCRPPPTLTAGRRRPTLPCAWARHTVKLHLCRVPNAGTR